MVLNGNFAKLEHLETEVVAVSNDMLVGLLSD
jgi:hypothetical protein